MQRKFKEKSKMYRKMEKVNREEISWGITQIKFNEKK